MLLYGEKFTNDEIHEMPREEFDKRTATFILSRQPMASELKVEAIVSRAWKEANSHTARLARVSLYEEASYCVGWILDLIGLYTGEVYGWKS